MKAFKRSPPPPVIARVYFGAALHASVCITRAFRCEPAPPVLTNSSLAPALIQNVISRSLRCSFEAHHQNHGCFVQKEKPRQTVRGADVGSSVDSCIL